MINIWIGDFRCIQLQKLAEFSKESEKYEKPEEVTDEEDTFNGGPTIENIYIVSEDANVSWLKSEIENQKANLYDGNAIFMLGINDCIDSCIYNKDIKTYTKDYIEFINNFITEFPNIKAYFCSVDPVSKGFPCAAYKDGIVPVNLLNNTIIQFNQNIKDNCEAIYIDSYNYLKATGFNLRDGIRYAADTNMCVQKYILSKTARVSSSSFVPRTTAPEIDDTDGNDFWVSISNGGYNPFPKPSKYTKSAGDTLPNCTAYAWGRFYEILGEEPKLARHNAEYWYLRDGLGAYKKHFSSEEDNDGYKRGQEPMEGAVICWQNGDIGGSGATRFT